MIVRSNGAFGAGRAASTPTATTRGRVAGGSAAFADAPRELDGLAEREPDAIEVDNASRPAELVAKEILARLLIGSG